MTSIPTQGYFSRCAFQYRPASRQRVWNPGHYLSLYSSLTDLDAGEIKSNCAAIYTAISTRPAVKGVCLTVTWPDLETSYGVYDDSRIDAHLARCVADGKHLCVRIGHKTFSPSDHAVPAYMQAGANDALYGDDDGGGTGASTGGEYQTTVGYVAKLNVASVYARFIALVQHIGERYNDNDNFEMIYFNETSQGNPVDYTFTTAVTDGFYANMALMVAEARLAAPRKVVVQLFNYPQERLTAIYMALKSAGVGIGHPDIFTSTAIGETNNTEPLNHNIQLAGAAAAFNSPNDYDRAYTYCADANDKIPIMCLVSPDSWTHSRSHQSTPDTYLPPATASEILTWCAEQMFATHVFWYYDNVTPDTYNVATAYDYRELVVSGGTVYQSKIAGNGTNTGNAVGNTTYWENLGTNFPAITNQFYPLMDTMAAVEAGGLNATYPSLL